MWDSFVYKRKVEGERQTAMRYMQAVLFAFCPLPFAYATAGGQVFIFCSIRFIQRNHLTTSREADPFILII
jgi:hypothetical protein